jgi:hypothetical protein
MALIVEVPVPTAAASPLASMVATDVFDDPQVAWLVRFWVELSV